MNVTEYNEFAHNSLWSYLFTHVIINKESLDFVIEFYTVTSSTYLDMVTLVLLGILHPTLISSNPD